MPYAPQGAAGGIIKLSELAIDASKDWLGHLIKNIGTPADVGDALRKGTRLALSDMPTGADGYFLKARGAGVDPEYAAVAGSIWTLLETLSPANVSSVSSSTLTAQDLYMVVVRLSGSYASEQALEMQLNGDTGNNYNTVYLDGTTLTSATNTNRILLSSYTNSYPQMVGQLFLPGKLGAALVPVSGHCSPTNTGHYRFLYGYYNAAANITSFTFRAQSGTIAGKIKIYGMSL